jgi:hypothetical protein
MIAFPVPRASMADYLRSDEPRARLDQTDRQETRSSQVGRADACFETKPGGWEVTES